MQEIKNKLPEFIQEEANKVKVHSSGDIDCQCLNPEHPDHNPSMFVGMQVPHIAHCRSCGVSYNIFQANHILHDAPLYGLQFIEKNANQLALKYGIEPVDISQIDETVLVRLRAQNIHDVASQILGAIGDRNHTNYIKHDYVRQLGIKDEVIKTMRIGTVLDNRQFFDAIKKEGNWSTQDLEEAGLRHWLFGPEKITYTIFNNYGQPVAFAARNLDFDGRFGVQQNPKQDRKWINSSVSIIYDKSECLYGIHVARKQTNNKVYIFEGYTDVCVAYSYGIKNAVCIGGTSFSPAHVKMLAEAEFSVAVIALDNDVGGLAAVDSVLEKGFSEVQSIKPQVLLVPESPKNDGSGGVDTDPDTYIKLFGAEAFMALKPKNAFKYTIDRIPDKLDNADQKTAFLQRFMPIIMNETSAVTQDEMRKDIAHRIGVSVELIKETQHRIEVQKDHHNRELIRRMFKKTTKDLYDAIDLYPDRIPTVVSQFKDYVDETLDAEQYLAFGSQEVKEGVDSWWENLQHNSLDNMFWKTGYPFWDGTIGGIKKQGNFTGITGAANCGKSALLMNLAMGVLRNNDTEDLLLLYWTIDDPRTDTLTKMLSILVKAPISTISNYASLKDSMKKKIRNGYSHLRKWIEKDKCFSIKDMGIGATADDVTRWVEQEIARQPNKKVLLFIDNFANMTAPSQQDDMAVQIANINKLHRLRASNNIAIVSSFEVNKEGTDSRAGAKSVYGSGKITYRLTLNLSLYNEVDIIRTQNQDRKPTYYWMDQYDANKPVVELALIKSKMTFKDPSFNGKVFFRFVNHVGCMNEIGNAASWQKFKSENASGLHSLASEWLFEQAPLGTYNGTPLPVAAPVATTPEANPLTQAPPQENKTNNSDLNPNVF